MESSRRKMSTRCWARFLVWSKYFADGSAEHDEAIDRKITEILKKVFAKKKNKLPYSAFKSMSDTEDLMAALV